MKGDWSRDQAAEIWYECGRQACSHWQTAPWDNLNTTVYYNFLIIDLDR